MIAAADSEGSGIDDGQVAGNVLTLLLAGEDTTANTLAWMIHLLWLHPGALARARDEVRRIAGGAGAGITQEQLGELDFVEACIHETMRLKPVAPLLGLQALHDTVVGEVSVPDRTVILALPAAGRRQRRALRTGGELRSRALDGPRRGRRQAHRHALRRGPAHLPRPLPGAAGDQAGDGDAAEPLRDRIRRPAARPGSARGAGLHDGAAGADDAPACEWRVGASTLPLRAAKRR